MKFSILFFFFLLSFNFIQAQNEREMPAGDMSKIQIRTSRLFGKLVDEKTGKNVEAASVQLYKAGHDSLINGMLSKSNGDFSLEMNIVADSFRLLISAIGYEPWQQIIKTSTLRKNSNDAKF